MAKTGFFQEAKAGFLQEGFEQQALQVIDLLAPRIMNLDSHDKDYFALQSILSNGLYKDRPLNILHEMQRSVHSVTDLQSPAKCANIAAISLSVDQSVQDIQKLMIKHDDAEGMNILAQGTGSMNSLLIAATNQHREVSNIIRSLVGSKADPLCNDDGGNTAFAASAKHHPELSVAQFYIDASLDSNPRNSVVKKLYESVEDICLNKADHIKKDMEKAIALSMKGRDIPITPTESVGVSEQSDEEESDDCEASDGEVECSPLVGAIEANNIELVEHLLDEGADIEELIGDDEYTPLIMALGYRDGGNTDAPPKEAIAKLLIARGADVTEETLGEWSVVHQASYSNLPQILEALNISTSSLYGSADDTSVIDCAFESRAYDSVEWFTKAALKWFANKPANLDEEDEGRMTNMAADIISGAVKAQVLDTVLSYGADYGDLFKAFMTNFPEEVSKLFDVAVESKSETLAVVLRAINLPDKYEFPDMVSVNTFIDCLKQNVFFNLASAKPPSFGIKFAGHELKSHLSALGAFGGVSESQSKAQIKSSSPELEKFVNKALSFDKDFIRPLSYESCDAVSIKQAIVNVANAQAASAIKSNAVDGCKKIEPYMPPEIAAITCEYLGATHAQMLEIKKKGSCPPLTLPSVLPDPESVLLEYSSSSAATTPDVEVVSSVATTPGILADYLGYYDNDNMN